MAAATSLQTRLLSSVISLRSHQRRNCAEVLDVVLGEAIFVRDITRTILRPLVDTFDHGVAAFLQGLRGALKPVLHFFRAQSLAEADAVCTTVRRGVNHERAGSGGSCQNEGYAHSAPNFRCGVSGCAI